jgi:hypothetical protein
MKKLLAIVVLGLLLTNCDRSNKVSRIIENCADNLVKKEEIKILDKYKASNDLKAEIIFLTKSLQEIERWINFLENEIEILDTKWDQNYAFYLKHLDEYKRIGISDDFPYLKLFNDKYLKNITGELLRNDSYRKKVGSTYFRDKNTTRRQLLKALNNNKRWDEEKKARIDYLLTPEGEKEFNDKLIVNMNMLSTPLKKFRKQKLTKKIQEDKINFSSSSFSYVNFFKICETARKENPILFDAKFKK